MGTRYAKADEAHKLLYVDANNLYGWAMMQYLPCGKFTRRERPTGEPGSGHTGNWHFTKEDILAIPDDSPYGHFFEVDLDYPDRIKPISSNFPFCPESMCVQDDELSDYQLALLGGEKRPKVEKLVLTQNNKRNYMVHYRLLKFYLESGMILKKVHTIIDFQQSKWLGPYIDFNTKQRMVAETDFEKDFFKLMNNAFYGKTCENIRKRQEVKLVNDPEEALKLVANPKFHSKNIFDDELCAILFRKTSVNSFTARHFLI